MRSHLRVNGRDDSRLLSAVIDLRWPEQRQVKELTKKLGQKLECSASQLRRAWQKAGETLREFNAQLASANADMLERLEREGRVGIVILGRPYNVFDTGMNLELTQKIAELGFYVLPLDALPFKPELFGNEFKNIYWSYGQRIISALLQIREQPRLFPIYFSNFNCGPDSFLIQYAEQIMGDKPLLALEFDEHGADAGYLTRVEAFLDVVRNLGQFTAKTGIYLPKTDDDEFRKRKIFVPPMHPLMPRLGVAAMKGFGYQAEVLPLETEESLELGRSVSRGSECLPTASTVGTLLKTLEERKEDPKKCAFFMATADGPCRFGQYALLHRMILNRKGFDELILLSPSSINSYQGLPEDLRKRIWHCIVMGDLLFKAGCRVRPYEINQGETDQAIENIMRELEAALVAGKGFEKKFAQGMTRLASIPVRKARKPLVGIVGEIYVRANLFDNDQVVKRIEEFGGEAWLSPLSEWFFYTTYMQDHRAREGYVNVWARGQSLMLNRFLSRVEEKYLAMSEPLLLDRREPEISEVVEAGKKYLPLNFEGEAILTVGRAVKFLEQGAQLVVNAAPFGCMPGTICNALLQEISQQNQLPIVSIFYDGKPGMNQRLRVLIENLA
jgi:predicted nucleotide-binding protein (sugar kinase/HSP70/actin superfamily)